ncbi:hypothetical protein M3Y98_00713500 [Aphelenchoides besseyi]|nr:hypothetical protein M3Y98_00713500 [Aphelenchoides besseyi]KAI6210306.1 hypothetical protein M3Y96_00314100 [Aphelenchoides besseyi]
MSAARFLFLAIALCVCVVDGTKAKYNVVGQLKCRGYPYNGAFVAFFEHDNAINDLCAVVKSNSSGYYHSTAIENDGPFVWPDELFFIVAHRCDTHKYKCVKRSLGDKLWTTDLESQDPPHVVDTINLSEEKREKCDERMDSIIEANRILEPEDCYSN